MNRSAMTGSKLIRSGSTQSLAKRCGVVARSDLPAEGTENYVRWEGQMGARPFADAESPPHR